MVLSRWIAASEATAGFSMDRVPRRDVTFGDRELARLLDDAAKSPAG
jgi:hypothetical protein